MPPPGLAIPPHAKGSIATLPATEAMSARRAPPKRAVATQRLPPVAARIYAVGLNSAVPSTASLGIFCALYRTSAQRWCTTVEALSLYNSMRCSFRKSVQPADSRRNLFNRRDLCPQRIASSEDRPSRSGHQFSRNISGRDPSCRRLCHSQRPRLDSPRNIFGRGAYLHRAHESQPRRHPR